MHLMLFVTVNWKRCARFRERAGRCSRPAPMTLSLLHDQRVRRCKHAGTASSIAHSSRAQRMTQWHALSSDARAFIHLAPHVLETEHSKQEGEKEGGRGGLNGSPQPFSRSWIINSAEQFTEQITKSLILVPMSGPDSLQRTRRSSGKYVWTLVFQFICTHTRI